MYHAIGFKSITLKFGKDTNVWMLFQMTVEGDRGREPGRIGDGRGVGKGSGKGGKRDSQGGGNREKREKFCNIV